MAKLKCETIRFVKSNGQLNEFKIHHDLDFSIKKYLQEWLETAENTNARTFAGYAKSFNLSNTIYTNKAYNKIIEKMYM